ncbi:MAG: hypothetical protein M1824_001931 [Vezdaea acicularis]|nr:MAG: hypothetical protein M1824_001931 [Vezdaea acicularis]
MVAQRKTVVVLGSSWAALNVAHRLLKHTLPKNPDFKVVMVAPSSHLYWNIAAPRGYVRGQFEDKQLFHPILPAFEAYPKGSFEYVAGTAEEVNPTTKSIRVTQNAGGEQSVSYDYLVIATGSSPVAQSPFKHIGTYDFTLSQLHEMQQKIVAAKSIVVAGAGATGGELAGELGENSTDKQITLIAGSKQVFPTAREDIGRDAKSTLEKLGVKVILDTKVVGEEKAADGKTKLILSDGQTLTTDLYIPAIGVTANSSFMPKNFLDAWNNIRVDSKLRVPGAPDVWAVGDVNQLQKKIVKHAEAQGVYAFKSLDAILTGKEDTIKEYDASGVQMFVAVIGKKVGLATAGNWRLPGFLVSYMKGRDFMTPKLVPYAEGQSTLMQGKF